PIEELVERDRQEARLRLLDYIYPHRFGPKEWEDYVNNEVSDRELDEVAKGMHDDEFMFNYIHYTEWCYFGEEDIDDEEFKHRMDRYSAAVSAPVNPDPTSEEIRSRLGYELPRNIDPTLWGEWLISLDHSLPPYVRDEFIEHLRYDRDPNQLLRKAIQKRSAYPIRWDDKYVAEGWLNGLRELKEQRAAGGRR